MMNFSQLDFGSFAVKIYGIFLAIAFFIAVWRAYKNIQKANLDIDFFVHHFWRWLLGGLLLGRIFSVLLLPEIWGSYGGFSFFAFWAGGINFLGAAIGFVSVLLFDFHLHQKSPWRWLDQGVLPFFLGFMIVDIGGFLTGAVYGTETNMFWGVRYETFGVASINPVHPVTLYALIVHIWIWYWLRKHVMSWQNLPGKLAMWGIFLFVISDFFLQFFKEQGLVILGLLTVTQLVELVLIIGSWWQIKSMQKKAKK